MARFSGVVQIGANGAVTVPVALPAFNGTVRLMAAAWSASSVGQASRDMVVRDRVMVTAAPPRFLAPGDRSRIRLEVVHAGGPAGEMRPALIANGGAISIDFPARHLHPDAGRHGGVRGPRAGARRRRPEGGRHADHP
jgi:uncharacterized protein YfaS (alpha-2-macroglobulin family)